MQETRVLVETKGTTGEETTSYWFDLPIDVAEFEEKLGIGAESGDYRIIEKVLPYADEVHEHTSVYQLNELDFMYRQLSSDMQEEYVSLLTVHDSFRQLIAQSREGKIHALQIATESSIRSMQEQSKKLVTGKLKEVAYQKIDEQTEALVSMIGDNQVDYRFCGNCQSEN